MGNTRRIRAQTHYSPRATRDRGPFCLNETGRGDRVTVECGAGSICASSDVCSETSSKWISAGRHGHEPRPALVLLRGSFRAAGRHERARDAPAELTRSLRSASIRGERVLVSLAWDVSFPAAARIRMTERNALHPRVCGARRDVRGATPHKRRYAKIPPESTFSDARQLACEQKGRAYPSFLFKIRFFHGQPAADSVTLRYVAARSSTPFNDTQLRPNPSCTRKERDSVRT